MLILYSVGFHVPIHVLYMYPYVFEMFILYFVIFKQLFLLPPFLMYAFCRWLIFLFSLYQSSSWLQKLTKIFVVFFCSGDGRKDGRLSYVWTGTSWSCWVSGWDHSTGGWHGHHTGLWRYLYPLLWAMSCVLWFIHFRSFISLLGT